MLSVSATIPWPEKLRPRARNFQPCLDRTSVSALTDVPAARTSSPLPIHRLQVTRVRRQRDPHFISLLFLSHGAPFVVLLHRPSSLMQSLNPFEHWVFEFNQ
jgi:hypothetical protein